MDILFYSSKSDLLKLEYELYKKGNTILLNFSLASIATSCIFNINSITNDITIPSIREIEYYRMIITNKIYRLPMEINELIDFFYSEKFQLNKKHKNINDINLIFVQ